MYRRPTSPIASMPFVYARYFVLNCATNVCVAVKQITLNTIWGKSMKFMYSCAVNLTTISVTQTMWRKRDSVNMSDLAKYQTILLLKIQRKNLSLQRQNLPLGGFPSVYQFSSATRNPHMHGFARKYCLFALSWRRNSTPRVLREFIYSFILHSMDPCRYNKPHGCAISLHIHIINGIKYISLESLCYIKTITIYINRELRFPRRFH
jgi:hypothetical protein